MFYGGSTRFITCSCPPPLPLPQFTDLGPDEEQSCNKSEELLIDLTAKEALRTFCSAQRSSAENKLLVSNNKTMAFRDVVR